jgi:hypothetical protein
MQTEVSTTTIMVDTGGASLASEIGLGRQMMKVSLASEMVSVKKKLQEFNKNENNFTKPPVTFARLSQ